MVYSKEMYQRNKDRISKETKSYYQRHRQELLKKSRDNYKNRSEKKKMEYAEKQVERKREVRQKLIKMFGGKCVKCGFDDWRALQIDHINGGGNKQRQEDKRFKDQRAMLKLFMEHPEEKSKCQLLCANCNWVKRYEGGERWNG